MKVARTEAVRNNVQTAGRCRSLQHRPGIRSMFIEAVSQSPADVAVGLTRLGSIDSAARARAAVRSPHETARKADAWLLIRNYYGPVNVDSRSLGYVIQFFDVATSVLLTGHGEQKVLGTTRFRTVPRFFPPTWSVFINQRPPRCNVAAREQQRVRQKHRE